MDEIRDNRLKRLKKIKKSNQKKFAWMACNG